MMPELARQVTVIRESCGIRNCRKRQIRPSQKLQCTLQSASHQIIVRGHTFRLLERFCKVRHRQARNTGEHLKANFVLQMGLDIFAHASNHTGRQATAKHRAQSCESDVSGFYSLRFRESRAKFVATRVWETP